MNSFNKFNQNIKIVGVIGHPIKHSFSPLMHNIAFDILKLDYSYLPFDVPISNLKDALKGILALGIKGVNVTLPLKEKIIDYLSEISEEANVVGSVNTVVNENGKLHGYNTDVHGIYETLNPYKDEITGSVVTLIGSGGASRSVIYTLIRYFKPKEINIINRTEQKAESLKNYFSSKMLFDDIKTFSLVPPDLVDIFRNSNLIINTTSVGLFPEIDDSPTTIEDSFIKGQIVFDVVYNPLKTKFFHIAEKKGVSTLNGFRMFVEQGDKSFELWTGEEFPKEKIFKTLTNYLK